MESGHTCALETAWDDLDERYQTTRRPAQELLEKFKIDNKLGPIENFITGKLIAPIIAIMDDILFDLSWSSKILNVKIYKI